MSEATPIAACSQPLRSFRTARLKNSAWFGIAAFCAAANAFSPNMRCAASELMRSPKGELYGTLVVFPSGPVLLKLICVLALTTVPTLYWAVENVTVVLWTIVVTDPSEFGVVVVSVFVTVNDCEELFVE